MIADQSVVARGASMYSLITHDKAAMRAVCFHVPWEVVTIASPFQQLAGAEDHMELLYFDGHPEIACASRAHEWSHDVPTPQRPQSKGVAARTARCVLERTRVVLMTSGSPHEWWAEALLSRSLYSKDSWAKRRDTIRVAPRREIMGGGTSERSSHTSPARSVRRPLQ